MGLGRDNWAELWGVPLGGLQVTSENESAESWWDKNGKVRGWDGFITAIVDLVPPAGLFLAKICPRDKNGARTKSNAKKCNLNCPYENLSLAHFIFVLGTLFKVLGSIGKNFDRTLA